MSPADLPPELGPRVAGDPEQVGPYRVVGRLGAGGMGVVFGAVDGHGAHVAVKVVHRDYAADPEFRRRFAREVELVRRVQARCTPGFAGADSEAPTPWLATEYVAGPTLREHVQREGPMEEGMLSALAAGLAEALHAIHTAGVVHRDLKPGNVILADRGPVVLDFGIARALDATRLTRTGGLVGSPGWIAPERYEGAEAEPAADVFAWGGLVAFAATGRSPFGGGAPHTVAARTMRQAPDLAGVPEALLPLVEAALAKHARHRPDAEALARELGASAPEERQAPTAPTQALTRILDRQWRGPEPLAPEPEWRKHTPRPRFRPGKTPVLGAGAAALAIALIAAIATADAWWPRELVDDAFGNGLGFDADAPAVTEQQQEETSSDGDLPGNVATIGDYRAENPGIFHQEINGRPVLEVEMTGLSITESKVEFEGQMSYLANTGTREASTGLFYFPDTGPETAAELSAVPREVVTPGEVFGILSPENNEVSFSFEITATWDLTSGAIVFNSGSQDEDPHLCYRSEPYAATGTHFLHNEGDTWTDCAADAYA